MPIHTLTPRYSVYTQAPDTAGLSSFVDQGFKSLVNLRQAGEPGEVLDPVSEGAEAEAMGLTYLHHATGPQQIGDADHVDALYRAMLALPAPILVHCASGARAAALALMVAGVSEQWLGEKAIEKAAEAGMPVPDALRPKIADYLSLKISQR